MLVVGITNRLIVKIKNENLYLLQTKNKYLTLITSNKLTQKEDIEYAHPDFIKKKVLR